MIEDVLAIPDHLRDALWRVDSARLEAGDSRGLLVCGMGGSAIGGDLAVAAIGQRLTAPMTTVRGYRLPGGVDDGWTVLCSSYSGNTEETLSCFEAAAETGARRVVVSTGGAIVDRARADGVQVVGLPGILQPRAAVAYMLVAAAEIAAKAGVAPSLRAEIEAAATFLEERQEELRERAAAIGAALAGTVPVVYGAELTAPVARRWKTQINENAKAPAFHSELPEADHNEICGWAGAPEGTSVSAAMIEDPDQGEELGRRFELTAAEIAGAGSEVVSVQALGETRTERLLYATMLGDLVSLELAEARGVDPLPVEAIERLKSSLAGS
ncbi:MAG TPA: bifunctional phosphoglucose/phosphomannose isomerase [Solirubrobacterales bacterium]